jgi:hypothetical protein
VFGDPWWSLSCRCSVSVSKLRFQMSSVSRQEAWKVSSSRVQWPPTTWFRGCPVISRNVQAMLGLNQSCSELDEAVFEATMLFNE